MLLVAGSVAPSEARAGCGHDVTSNLIRSVEESLFDLDVLKAAATDRATPGPRGPASGSARSGPSCSKGRNLPQAPATSIQVRISDPCCCMTFATGGNGPDAAEKLADLPIAHPRHNSSPLERPPRHPRSHTLS